MDFHIALILYIYILLALSTSSPTNSPTISPTEAPYMQFTPTQSPIFTATTLYIRQNGCDYGVCSHPNTTYTNNQCANLTSLAPVNNTPTPVYQPTCNTMDYAYKCLLGSETDGYPDQDICSKFNYAGSGAINLGDGLFNISTRINIDDGDITLIGNSMEITTLNYIGSDTPSGWLGCRWHKCYIRIIDLSVGSDISLGINTNTWKQFVMTEGGTMEVDNVLFDGSNIAVNSGTSFWDISGSRSRLIVRNSVFRNNDVHYKLDGVNVIFINCVFESNILTTNDVLSPMFESLNVANISFDGCIFSDNVIDGRSLIGMYSGSSLVMNNCTFINNTATWNGDINNNIIHIESSIRSMEIVIANTIFEGSQNFYSIIGVSTGSTTTIDMYIDNNIFRGGINNRYDIRSGTECNLVISNSQFVHGHLSSYSLYLQNARDVLVENTIWSNYIAQSVVHKTQNGDSTVSFNNIIMSNIDGRGFYITEGLFIHMDNVMFY
eukprot:146286_1